MSPKPLSPHLLSFNRFCLIYLIRPQLFLVSQLLQLYPFQAELNQLPRLCFHFLIFIALKLGFKLLHSFLVFPLLYLHLYGKLIIKSPLPFLLINLILLEFIWSQFAIILHPHPHYWPYLIVCAPLEQTILETLVNFCNLWLFFTNCAYFDQ